MLGPLRATDIHTPGLTLKTSEDAQLVPPCSSADELTRDSGGQIGVPWLSTSRLQEAAWSATPAKALLVPNPLLTSTRA
jgi:hypothetical protein